MTDTQIAALIEAVEAGRWPFDPQPWMTGAVWTSICGAFNDDLNAARALHNALLGEECHVNIMEDEDAGGWQVEVYLSGWHYAGGAVMARVWLLAILRAHQSQQETGQ